MITKPLDKQGFHLDKSTFSDSLRVRHNTQLKHLLTRCVDQAVFDIEHSLSYKKGEFITLRHDEVKDFQEQQLTVCNDKRIEPQLKLFSGVLCHIQSAKTTDDARVDNSARSGQRSAVLGTRSVAILYVGVFNPLVSCYNLQNLKSMYMMLEFEKSSLKPLVFACTGASFTGD